MQKYTGLMKMIKMIRKKRKKSITLKKELESN